MKRVTDYYSNFNEKDRLESCFGQIEFVRSQQIITRYLPKAPAVVLDVGGAAGRYSCWLAGLGYEVHLIDPVPKHIEEEILLDISQRLEREPSLIGASPHIMGVAYKKQ